MTRLKANQHYGQFLASIKERIRQSQYEALKAVNKELIALYWDIGRMIVDRQKKHGWGKAIVENLAEDLQKEFPGMQGFSVQNLWYMRQFYMEYHRSAKLQPLVGEISWTKHLNRQVKAPGENAPIGISVCKTKNKMVVEYALAEARKPIGVATYKMTTKLPKDLKKELPAPEQVGRLLQEI